MLLSLLRHYTPELRRLVASLGEKANEWDDQVCTTIVRTHIEVCKITLFAHTNCVSV